MTSKLLLIEKQNVLGFMTDFYRDANGELYMTREQIGRCLGFASPAIAIAKIHDRYKELLKGHFIQTFINVPIANGANNDASSKTLINQNGECIKPIKTKRVKSFLYTEEGVYLLAFHANTEKAFAFQEAVAGILANLRKGYQVWLLEREKGKFIRRTLTDAIKEDYPDSPHKRFMYKNFTDLAYRTVFGKTAKQLKEEYGDNIRDKLSDSQLKKLKAVEGLIENYIALGYSYDTIKSILTPMLE